ncbi:Hypothetical predicted protein [Octopus vulgaris]|uniref:Uncharacterized protein n=1 Tax=Octopus vulgaris TaxID=6645 RepID=A0AA36BM63_OCTVU|nr:Hypothetical predicted protein [Octopus vulgaris]
MTNIYADKTSFGNGGNECDVVGLVNGNHVNKANNEICKDENTMDDNGNGRDGVANYMNYKCELRSEVGPRSNEGDNSMSSKIDYEGRVGMTNNANSSDNHNNDVGEDISDYKDYQGRNDGVNSRGYEYL